ncbi:S8 family peptidase [Nonomuraea longicatena]|uniref:Uncharacterized protein n=1 Tax=Nonomuraea longicatena TaxID=83682 RepID=A0ABN1PAD6_9ACTN
MKRSLLSLLTVTAAILAGTPAPQAGAAEVRTYVVSLEPAAATRSGSSTRELARRLAARYDGTIKHVYTSALQGFAASMSARNARKLAEDPLVAAVEASRVVRPMAVPSWGLDRIDQRRLPLDGKAVQGGSAAGVTAYLVDSGILRTHEEFGGRARYGFDAIDSDAVADDCYGHGTHVAGILGGRTYGVAKDVSMVAVKVLDCQGNGATADIVAAVDWITRNARRPAVVNMSLESASSEIMDTAVEGSLDTGLVYVVAAGNRGGDACRRSPSGVRAAVTVGATTMRDTKATFSNWGACVDLFAPGEDVASAWNTGDTASAVASGTSMASPHVAGAAALLLRTRPEATPAEIARLIQNQATKGVLTDIGATSENSLLYVEDVL